MKQIFTGISNHSFQVIGELVVMFMAIFIAVVFVLCLASIIVYIFKCINKTIFVECHINRLVVETELLREFYKHVSKLYKSCANPYQLAKVRIIIWYLLKFRLRNIRSAK
jgi:hypothetical protein